MSYSLQLYTLRNAISEDLPGTIRKVAEIVSPRWSPTTSWPPPRNSAPL